MAVDLIIKDHWRNRSRGLRFSNAVSARTGATFALAEIERRPSVQD